MPGLVDVAWFAYQNSGPLLQMVLLTVVIGGWKKVVKPWLERLSARADALEADIDNHDEALASKRLNGRERDLLLENAHERVDELEQAHEDAVKRLKNRVLEIERAIQSDYEVRPGLLMRGGETNHDDEPDVVSGGGDD